MKDTVLSIRDLTKSYGDLVALKGVSIDIGEGEFVGLIGPNGAGKSTLINCITGMIGFDEGALLVNGIDIQETAGAINDFYSFSPDPSFFPGILNAYDVLEFVYKLKKAKKKGFEEEIQRVLELTNLSGEATKPITSYSTGMRQKLSICVALVGRPRLIILDETLNGIDPVSSFKIKQHLKQLTEEGVSIIMSSHILETIEKYCDRIIIINEGTVSAVLDRQKLEMYRNSVGKRSGRNLYRYPEWKEVKNDIAHIRYIYFVLVCDCLQTML